LPRWISQNFEPDFHKKDSRSRFFGGNCLFYQCMYYFAAPLVRSEASRGAHLKKFEFRRTISWVLPSKMKKGTEGVFL
jgi:hypothetical protein